MKKIVAFCLVLLLSLLPSLAVMAQSEQYVRKDPILAGALSWYVPGLGQFYAGAFVKGAIFWVVEETLLVSTILTLAELELNVTGDIGLGLNIKSKENPAKGERRTALVLGTSLIVLHFINVVDAVNTTRNYNKKQGRGLVTELRYDEENKVYSVGIEGRF